MFSFRAQRAQVLALLALFTLVPALTFAQSTVPAPWRAVDIDRPTPAGVTTFNNGVFTLASGGIDIGDRVDQFHFVYQPISGDTRLVARIDNLVPADPASKVGLMIRGSLANNSAHGYVYVNGVNQLAFGRRRRSGARTSTMTASTPVTGPVWLSVARTGTTVTTAFSTNGTTWTTLGTDSVALGTTAYVGYAIAARSSTSAAQADITNGQANGLPGSMRSADIGAPALAGSARYNAGTYVVTAGGTDIWGTSDQFHFVYQPMTGDAEVIARVASIVGGSASVKAGVMVRESLSASAAHAFDLVSFGAGMAYQSRPVAGGGSEHMDAGGGVAPHWVRLLRSGTRLEAFRSLDGVTWSLIGTRTITLPQTIYVGLAVTANSTTTAATVAFDNVSISNVSTPATNQPPSVTLTAPAGNITAVAPANLTLSANASDPEGRLARVEFLANGQLIGSDTSAPFTVTWTGVAAGTYSLSAVAVDQEGARATSASVSATVTSPANQPPSAVVTSPVAYAAATAPATFVLTATASDPEGRLARVEFFVNSMLVASVGTAPFSASWTATAAGNYSVTAVAVDQEGNRGTSAAVPISVTAPVVTVRRFVVFTASVDHQTNVSSYRLNVYAAGVNTATAPTLATADLGKPTPDANQDIAVDQTTLLNGLSTGNYLMTVTAIGPGGTTPSTSAVSFTR